MIRCAPVFTFLVSAMADDGRSPGGEVWKRAPSLGYTVYGKERFIIFKYSWKDFSEVFVWLAVLKFTPVFF